EPVGSNPRTIPDFDGLGVDQYNLYITANMTVNFDFPHYIKVWIIPKVGLISGGPLVMYTFGSPPSPPLANPVTGINNITIMPSINHDLTAEHMIATPIETAGTLGRSTLWTVNDPSGTPTLSATDLLLPGWNGPLHFDCGQLGGGSTPH